MKFGAGSTLLTHLLAVILGIGIWSLYRSASSDYGNSERPQTAQSSKADSPAQADVMRRLKAYRDEIEERQKERDQSDASSIGVEKDTRSQDEITLDFRKEYVVRDQVQLEVLLKRAKDFEKYNDLQIPLKDIFLQEEKSDDGVAVFLEWYRRDPAKAFDELAARGKWCAEVINTDALMFFLKPDEIITQLNARNRSSDFRKDLINELGYHLAYTDDIEGLNDYYKKLDTNLAMDLASRFHQIGWVPKNPDKALEFAANQMDVKLREGLAAGMTYDYFNNDSKRDNAERFMSPFLHRFVNADDLAEAKERAKSNHHDTSGSGSCGGGDEFEIEGLDEQQALQKLMNANTSRSLDQALEMLICREKDYPELFLRDQISGEEIFIGISKVMPNHQFSENQIRLSLYNYLAVWNPKAAVGWASNYLTSDELQSASFYYGDHDATDSRALNLLGLMEQLPSKYVDGRYHGDLPRKLYNSLESWREMDAKAVELVLSRSAETIAISEKLKNEPKYSFDTEDSESE